jgi:hypothetical protein
LLSLKKIHIASQYRVITRQLNTPYKYTMPFITGLFIISQILYAIRRLYPNKSPKAEPNNQAAPGTGTGFTATLSRPMY